MQLCRFVRPRLSVLIFILLGLFSSCLCAAEATLSIWHRDITTFRMDVAGFPPSERVSYSLSRLESAPTIEMRKGVKTKYWTHEGQASIAFYYGDHFLFNLHEGDVGPGSNLKDAEKQAIEGLESFADAKTQQRKPRRIIIGAAVLLGSTLLFLILLKLISMFRGWVKRSLAIEKVVDRKIEFLGVDFKTELRSVVQWVLLTLSWIIIAVLGYVYVVLALRAFPYTEVWGQLLGRKVIGVVMDLISSFVKSIPDLITLVIIFFIVRALNRLIKYTFNTMESSKNRGRWMDDDTRKATRRVLSALVWIFGVVVAYPYIPGSDSEAFKGISVLIGLMVSLGSTGLVNQVVAGFVVLYSGAVRSGEFVHMGDVEGTLTEVGLLSCKVLTPRGEYITVPNAVIMSDKTVNYSRLAKSDGAILSTSITIGYDTPWRTVHRLMLDAAGNCDLVKKMPKPRIVQEELGDFAVKYTLVFNVDEPHRKPQILTDVHANIQDEFAEEGVQIMSPHFEGQPDIPVLPPVDGK